MALMRPFRRSPLTTPASNKSPSCRRKVRSKWTARGSSVDSGCPISSGLNKMRFIVGWPSPLPNLKHFVGDAAGEPVGQDRHALKLRTCRTILRKCIGSGTYRTIFEIDFTGSVVRKGAMSREFEAKFFSKAGIVRSRRSDTPVKGFQRYFEDCIGLAFIVNLQQPVADQGIASLRRQDSLCLRWKCLFHRSSYINRSKARFSIAAKLIVAASGKEDRD